MDRVKPFPSLDPLRSLPLVLVSLFVVVAAVDILLAVQPVLIQTMRTDWLHWMRAGGISAPWASLVAATVSISSVAFAAVSLSAFIRGVRAAPYLWLAPTLVAFCAVVIGRSQIAIPLPIPTSLFAVFSALLLVAGGALFRSDSFASNCLGAFLLATPIAALTAAYLLIQGTPSAGSFPFEHQAQILMFALVLASVGAPAIASALPRGLAGSRADPRSDEQMGEQLAALFERVKTSEARAATAEHQLARATGAVRSAPQLRLDDDELALMRPRGAGHWPLWAALALLGLGGALAYFGAYRPLHDRLQVQLRANHEHAQRQTAAMTALQARYDRERASLEQQLAAARPPEAAAAAAIGAQPARGEAASAGPATERRNNVPPGSGSNEQATTSPRQTWAERKAAREAATTATLDEPAEADAEPAATQRLSWAERKAARTAERAAAAAESAEAGAEAAATHQSSSAERKATHAPASAEAGEPTEAGAEPAAAGRRLTWAERKAARAAATEAAAATSGADEAKTPAAQTKPTERAKPKNDDPGVGSSDDPLEGLDGM